MMADEIPAWASDDYDPESREAIERLRVAQAPDPLEERSFEKIDYPQPAPDPYEERPKIVRPAPPRPAQNDVVDRALRLTSDQFQSNARPVVENGKINWGDQELGGSAADFFRADAARMAALEAASAPPSTAPARSGAGTGRVMAYAPTPGTDMDSPVLRAIRGAESSNNPRAQNPKSSAGGLYQFTDGTWGNVLRRMNPQVYGGYNNQQLRSLKFNTDIQNEAAKFHLNNDIVPALQKAGIPPTPGNVYLGWFQGPSGAIRAYRAPPNATVAQVFPETVAANAGTRFRGKPYAAWTMDDLRAFTESAMSRRMRASGGAVNDFIPHDDPRRQENFGNWFGYSHVVDERGNPMVLYHGTDADVDEFDPNKIGQTDHGWYGEGHYLTASPELASAYSGYKNNKAIVGEEIHPGQNVMPVYARLENPYYWPEDRAAATSKEEAKKITEELRKQGYDGVIAPNKHADMPEGKFWEVVVFTPHQIKSATGNSGHFNMQSPKLNKAEGGTVDDEDEGLTAYHGSPYDFERFDINKIGTGEGAQAYGHGLYFAESEPVAKGYRDRLREEYAFVDDKKIPHPSEENPESNLVYTLANQLYQMGWNTDQAIDFANKHAESLKDDLTSENFYKKGKAEHAQKWARDIAQFKDKKIEWKQDPGNMYEVRIKAKPEHFLDWDEPLYRQPEAVRRLVGITPEYENEWYKWFEKDNDNLINALENDGDYSPMKEPARPQGSLRMMMKGSDLYEHLHNKMGAIDWPINADSGERANVRKTAAEKVSQYLRDNGVPGIKYLDAVSRGAGEGSRNYVVFDHDLVKVKRKYALGGSVAQS
jgi:hypothetical protein